MITPETERGFDESASPGRTSRPGFWQRRKSLGLIAFGVAAVILIEGFALSWGGSASAPGDRARTHTITTIAEPDIRLCPKSKVQLIEVDFLRYPYLEGLTTLTGHKVSIVCGGLDDSHFVAHSTSVKVKLRRDAKIVLMALKMSPSFYEGNVGELNNYLSHDPDGNVFIVTGPDSGATGLYAVFHP